MTRPTDILSWGASAAASGFVEPAPRRDSGWFPGDQPPAENFNWLHRAYERWITYIDQERIDEIVDAAKLELRSPIGMIATRTLAAKTAAAANLWKAIAYSGYINSSNRGALVAISTDGANRTMYSTDYGETWTAVAAAAANTWQDVAYGGGYFVAVSLDGANRTMWSNNYGTSWTGVAAAAANQWSSICYSSTLTRFVAVAASGANCVMYGTNGSSWTAVSPPNANAWTKVIWTGSYFFAVSSGGTNRGMKSSDGITWTAVTTIPSKNYISVAYSPFLGRIVAIDIGTGSLVYSDNDGTSWTTVSSPGFSTSATSIIWAPDLNLFMVTDSGGVWISKDGIAWTVINAAANTWANAVYASDVCRIVAISNTGASRVGVSA